MDSKTSPPRARKNGRRTQAERTALSDKRMFEAAIRLIIDRGTQKTTLKDIGEQAGYSRGLANYRFGSKDGFMLELSNRFNALWQEHLNGYVGKKTGFEAIIAADRALKDFLGQESDYIRAMYILWYDSLGRDSEIRERLSDYHQVYRQDISNWIEQGIASGEFSEQVNAEQFAVQYCSFIFGTIYQWVVNSAALDLDALFADFEKNLGTILHYKDAH